jgi:hypothetical protein
VSGLQRLCPHKNLTTDALFMPAECFDYPRASACSSATRRAASRTQLGTRYREAKQTSYGEVQTSEYAFSRIRPPCMGYPLTEVEKITTRFCALGLPLIEDNPIAAPEKGRHGSILEKNIMKRFSRQSRRRPFQEGQLQESSVQSSDPGRCGYRGFGRIDSRFDEDGKLSVSTARNHRVPCAPTRR